MSLRDIQIDSEYRTLSCDMANDFYIPMLGEAILYKRAVGFFSSSALAAISAGIYELYENGGKIQLIASPRLSSEDIEAINDGYQQREEIIKGALKRELEDCTDFCQQNRLNLLATLIAKGILDIRIAVTIGKKCIGMYHEKMGLIEDIEGNIVAFSGSMNETDTAIHDNYEAIDVFCSWISTDHKRVERKNQAFLKMWDGLDENICIMKFPEIEKEFIEKYQMGDIDAKSLKEGWAAYHVKPTFGLVKPEWLNLYDYQQEAIKNWQANDYCGIFDMATGTGKTLTALGAVAELCKNVKRLAVIIVCPYQHLVEQWVEDIRAFGANPIIGYSGSSYTNYKKELKNRIFNFNYKITDFFCFITTNASFMSKAINEEIRKLSQDTILVVDEAHNFGAKNLQNTLQQDFTYRLALSATLERQGDEDGTNILRNFFGNKCIEYGLERAIAEKKLTPYYYYPVIVYLTDAELDKYQLYTSKIIQNIVKRKDKTIVTNLAKEFMLKRARLVAGASEKIEKLREMANDFKNEKNMLIYCGATNVQGYDNCSDDDIRQIDYISRMLNFDFGMRTAQFTSREDSKERKRRLEEFQNGEIQALIAIKCLDEGVNVPAIKTAYILASTTNPKEYIQRRGRVLRLYPGKEAAYIYDFITLPRELTTVENTSSELAKSERALVVKEIRRMREFCHIALNPYETQMLIMDLRDIYNVTEENILEKDEGELLYE
ncbi:MAG: DEAD/DEAH box helicase family protein [Veillonellaceae bacterium]|nr:DEAD/DEAH box helicase family protein [Veillonellaceae bacterium]